MRAMVGAVAVALLAPITAQAATVEIGNRSFDVTSGQVQNEGYQVAHSATKNVLWVTGTTHQFDLGFPQALKSALTKVNPSTLEVQQVITPPTLPAEGNPLTKSERPEAVYGVAVDDERDRVWTSATREDAVVVYDANTGNRLARIDGVGHTRDIAIDSYRDIAYVSDPNNGQITKINTANYQVIGTLTAANLNVPGFSPMSLDLHATATQSLLYTVNLNNGQVVELDNVGEDRRIIESGGNRASGIAVDRERGRIYVASQDSNDLRTIDLATGQPIATAQASGAVLNAAVDSEEGIVYSAVFGSNSVLVTDADTGARIGEIPLGTSPNDVIVAGGSAFAVDRSATGPEGKSQLWKITPTGAGNGPTDPEPEPAAASVTVVGQPTIGGTVTLRGTGWKHPTNGGSTVAIKLDDGAFLKPGGAANGVWQVIEAAADGTFEVTLQLPDGTTGAAGSTPAYGTGAHWLRFLTGSLKAGDQGRSVRVDITVGAAVNPGPTGPGSANPGTQPKPAAKAKPKVGASVKRKFSSRERVIVRAVVNGKKPTGTIVVRVGKRTVKVVKIAKRKGNQAIVGVRLPRLKAGTHTVTVTYLGDTANARSTSKAVLRVTR